MKRAIYLDEVDIDLIESALELWNFRLGTSREYEEAKTLHGHFYARRFTEHQIDAMRRRLKVLKESLIAQKREAT